MAGYTRQDTNDNIATGKVINASDFDNEYNQIEAAFNASTGHKHDGTAAEGPRITVIGPSGQFSTDANAFYSTNNATVGLGKVGNVWKDLYVDNIKIDGNIISSTDTNGNIELSPNGNGLVNLQASGDLAIGGVALTANATEFNTLAGLTATTNELNILDGSNTVQATVTLADADGVVISDADDSDTMKQALVSDIATYISTKAMTMTNKIIDANGTGNSITNLEVADFNGAAIVTEVEGLNSSDNDTSIPTTAAVKDYVDDNNLASGKIGDASDPVVFEVTVASKTTANPYAGGVNHGGGTASPSAYYINGQEAPSLEVFGHDVISGSNIGRIHYKFDQSNGSNSGHPLQFYLDAAKTIVYNPASHVTISGVPGQAGAYTLLKVDKDTPHQLYYQCTQHPYMGGLISSPLSTVFNATAVASTSGLLTLPTTDDTLVGRATTDTLTNKTITTLVNGGAITIPTGTDTLVGRATTDTLTNKTLTSPVITTPQINDTSADHQYVFAVSELAADRTVTLPLLGSDDEFVFKDHQQTLSNKTLQSSYAHNLRLGQTGGTNQDLYNAHGARLVGFGDAGVNAVNYLNLNNADTQGLGTAIVGMSAQGSDSDVALSLSGKNAWVQAEDQFYAQQYREGVSSLNASGATNVDMANYNVFEVTLTGTATLTFTNFPATHLGLSLDNVFGFTMKVKQNSTGNYGITWPASVKWAGGSAPTLTGTANSIDVFTFFSIDGGTNIYGFLAGADVK